MKRLLFSLILLLIASFQVDAQIEDPKLKEEIEKRGISESQVSDELKNRGLSEDDVKRELESRGLLNQGTQTGTPIPELPTDGTTTPPQTEAIKVEVPKETIDKVIDEVNPGNKQPKSPVYGKDIFRDKRFELLEPQGNFKAFDEYIVGSEDRITVSIFGNAEFNDDFVVNPDGYIAPRQLPRIYVKGLTFAEARQTIETAFGRVINLRDPNTKIEINLSYSRPVSLGIYGEVFEPGSYTISALNTAFNALTLAGGPNNLGTIRNIKVMRAGVPDKIIDVYDYLGRASQDYNIFLEDNDVIFVEQMGKVVSIKGEVLRPSQFEMLDNEGLTDLIRHAGGLLPNAYRSNIQLVRYTDEGKTLIDINLADLLDDDNNIDLQDGDIVTVFPVQETIKNQINITGAVLVGGNYAHQENMRLIDAINKAGLKEDARIDQIYILRTEDDKSKRYIRLNLRDVLNDPVNATDNILLRPRDQIKVASRTAFVTDYTVNITGSVREPGTFIYDEGLKVSDLLFFARGLNDLAEEIAVIRRSEPDLTEKVFRINILEVYENINSPYNYELKPKDRIQVFSKRDFIDDYEVRVSGAVRRPGNFVFADSMTLNDVLFLAGGLREFAAKNRIEISRIDKDAEEEYSVVIATLNVDDVMDLENQETFYLEPKDHIFVRNTPGISDQQNITITGEVRFPGDYALVDNKERLLSVLERAGGLNEAAFPKGATLLRQANQTGYVLVELEEVLKNPNSKFNYVLKPGDIIDIPLINDLVTVKGAIKHPTSQLGGQINVPFHKARNAKFYIKRYGAGIDRKEKRGRAKQVFVTDRNGQVKRTRSIVGFKVFPKVEKGSIIDVKSKAPKPPKPEKEPNPNKQSTGEIIANTVAQATAILTLLVLIDRAF